MKILHVVGARPNLVKGAPVIDALARNRPAPSQVIVHTGQHYDLEMSQFFIDELGLPDPDYSLAVASGSHSAQTGRILERTEPVLDEESPDAVVVAGDVRALAALAGLSRELPVVFPVHPRTRARIETFRGADSLHVLDPLGYLDFLALESSAMAVITDSGGIQEETTFLRIPCFTLREQTERPITVTRGTNRLLGLDIERIADVPRMVRDSAFAADAPDGWDGNAGGRVAEILPRDLDATPGSAQAATSETRP